MSRSLEVNSVNSISKIPKETWENIVDIDNPFFAYDFLLSLEKSGCTNLDTGWVPNHLIVERKGAIIAIIPNFIKYHSAGEYVFDQNWANAFINLGLNYYPKFLSAVPFTPINGDRIFYNKPLEDIDDFFEILIKFLKKQNISSHHFNFISKSQSDIMEKSGFLTRLGLQYHWYNDNYINFDDYLDSFKLKKKKNVLKERKYVSDQGIFFKIKKGNSIKIEDLHFFFKCYKNTIEKKWANQYLNFDFFKYLLQSPIKDKMVLFIAYEKQDEQIASALNFSSKDALYGRYWGCIKEIKNLHFELCYYQSIEFAIKNNLKLIESGAQGEHKIPRGYEPTVTLSNHWIKNEKISEALRKVLEHENKNVVDTIEYLKKLLPFKN